LVGVHDELAGGTSRRSPIRTRVDRRRTVAAGPDFRGARALARCAAQPPGAAADGELLLQQLRLLLLLQLAVHVPRRQPRLQGTRQRLVRGGAVDDERGVRVGRRPDLRSPDQDEGNPHRLSAHGRDRTAMRRRAAAGGGVGDCSAHGGRVSVTMSGLPAIYRERVLGRDDFRVRNERVRWLRPDEYRRQRGRRRWRVARAGDGSGVRLARGIGDRHGVCDDWRAAVVLDQG